VRGSVGNPNRRTTRSELKSAARRRDVIVGADRGQLDAVENCFSLRGELIFCWSGVAPVEIWQIENKTLIDMSGHSDIIGSGEQQWPPKRKS
jgi:hypothetical protein